MKFSVAICTWNRAHLLAQTLNSLCRLRIPPDCYWQVIVVDNNCTDNTPQVVREYARVLPLRSVRESRQGHSAARNAAVAHCDGDVVLWTDDDVLAPVDWIERYREGIDRTPGAAFWGGPIRPKFAVEPPRWLSENWQTCQGCFAIRDLGTESIELTADRLPYGANFAVRADVQRHFRFDESLGRRAVSLVGDDELDLMKRILQSGEKGYWIPAAAIEHVIPAERMTLDYVRRYFIGQGRRLRSTKRSRNPSALQLRATAIAQRCLFGLKYAWAKSPAWMAHWIRASLAEGQRQALIDDRIVEKKVEKG